jgi:hypothetical protein
VESDKFNTDRWTWTDRITGAATCVLIISLFLPWFRATASLAGLSVTEDSDGVGTHGYLYIVFIVALGIVVYLFARAARVGLSQPTTLAHEQILALAAGLNLVLVVIAFAFKPAGNVLVTVSWSYGAILALIMAAIAQAAAACAAIISQRH